MHPSFVHSCIRASGRSLSTPTTSRHTPPLALHSTPSPSIHPKAYDKCLVTTVDSNRDESARLNGAPTTPLPNGTAYGGAGQPVGEAAVEADASPRPQSPTLFSPTHKMARFLSRFSNESPSKNTKKRKKNEVAALKGDDLGHCEAHPPHLPNDAPTAPPRSHHHHRPIFAALTHIQLLIIVRVVIYRPSYSDITTLSMKNGW